MQTAEYDPQDFQRSGQREADKGLLVKFYVKPRQNKAESIKQGRPVFKDCEYIDIKTPGNRACSVGRPATDADKQRFNEHYAAFKERTDTDQNTGTPLTEWNAISRSMAEELAFYHVKTVEQLATMADVQTSKFMGLFTLREQAQKWLKRVESEQPMLEMEARMEKMEAENNDLRASLKEILAMQGEDSPLSAGKKKRKAKRAAKQVE